MNRITKILWILCIAISVNAGVVIKENRRAARIHISTFSAEKTSSVAYFAATCSSAVDKLIAADSTPAEYIDIAEAEDDGEEHEDSEKKLYFDDKTEMHEFTFRLMRALIRRRAREYYSQNNPNGDIVEFLAQAMTFRKISDMYSAGGGYAWDYSPARARAEKGKYPKAELLFKAPMPTNFQYFFQLNAMYCDLLLYSLEKFPGKHGVFVRRLIEADSTGQKPEETIKQVVIQSLPAGITLQGWFETHARQAFALERSATVQGTFMARVKELEQFSVISASRNYAVENIRIDDIPDAFSELKLDKAALIKRESQFMELRNESSPLIRPSLELYAKSLGMLASGDVKQFRENLAQARAELEKALARQAEISAVLREEEKAHVPVTERFRPFIDVMQRYRKLEDEILPIPE